jgi:Domain of unknown function (DUF4145)
MAPYTPPSLNANGFNCPLCSAFAKHEWTTPYRHKGGGIAPLNELLIAECHHCGLFSIWLNGRMVYPDMNTTPPPNEDLPADVKEDYLEATNILARSPRGATALLRLAVQKLCKHLGEAGKNINDDIGELVQKGLPSRVQQALDAVRVIGNNAVHPGQIDITDNRDVAAKLFELVNIVCDYMISQPKRVEAIYASLPPAQLGAIKNRDKV